MDTINALILAIGFLGALGIVATIVAPRLGVPILFVFLVVGMLAGEDGPGGIPFSNFWFANFAGSMALAVILFDGGLKTDAGDFKIGLKPAGLLATVGVLLTASIVALVAHWLLPLNWTEAFLLGAVVSSTDAAAVFGTLHSQRIGLNHRLRSVLEIESGANDPMAVLLTIGLVEALSAEGGMSASHALLFFVVQLGGGALIGWAGGRLLSWTLSRLRLPDPLYPLLAFFGALLIFGLAASVEASGFLASYLAGITLARQRPPAMRDVLRFHDGIAWMAQVGLFLILGLLATPHELPALLWPALGIGAALIFLARPLAVALCLWPLRFPWREQTFIAWVGLRGGVPIVLATYPLLAELPAARVIFDVAFFLVLMSLLLQGSTVAWAARQLNLLIPQVRTRVHRAEFDLPGQSGWEIISYRVAKGSQPVGRTVKQLGLPDTSRVVCVIREGRLLPYAQWGRLSAGDRISLLARPEELPTLDALFERAKSADLKLRDAYLGLFHLSPEAGTAEVLQAYGAQPPPGVEQETLKQTLRRLLPQPVEGDRVRLAGVELTVRRLEEGRIAEVGLRLPKAETEEHRTGPG
ncbi:MAG: potassium/proton antiporter [Nevskiaceae bacterium]|nr:MAG: potassium/proton antiporter [Nevskiaceae bacterium]TAM25619.1 MAG: potassium/proton antiporter [Nevskiaceae bacterium]